MSFSLGTDFQSIFLALYPLIFAKKRNFVIVLKKYQNKREL